MHGPLFGEFMGTLVLILLGDGVVANVLLKKSKGEGSGWIVIATGWSMAVIGRHLHGGSLRKPGSAHQSRDHAGSGSAVSQLGERDPVLDCAMPAPLRSATLVWLAYLPHWPETPGSGCQARHFLHLSSDSQLPRTH